jgi:anti-sigma factor RsiW
VAVVRHDWPLAALVLAVIGAASVGGVAWGSRAPPARAHLIDEIVEYHEIFSREIQHLVEVGTDQMEELTAWLGERVGRDIKVPDLTAAGLRFAGGRMLVISDQPVAALMYTRGEGLPIAFHVTRIRADDKPTCIQQHGSQRVASWISGGYAYVLVGEIDGSTAEELATLLAAQTES